MARKPSLEIGKHSLEVFSQPQFSSLALGEQPEKAGKKWRITYKGKQLVIPRIARCFIPERGISVSGFLVQVVKDPAHLRKLITVRKNGNGPFGSIILQSVYPSGKERHLGYTRIARVKTNPTSGEVMRLAVSSFFTPDAAASVLQNAKAHYGKLKNKYGGIKNRLATAKYKSRAWEKHAQLRDARVKRRILEHALEEYGDSLPAYGSRKTFTPGSLGLWRSDRRTLGRLLFFLREEIARKGGLETLFGDVPKQLFLSLHKPNGWVYDGEGDCTYEVSHVQCHKDLKPS